MVVGVDVAALLGSMEGVTAPEIWQESNRDPETTRKQRNFVVDFIFASWNDAWW
jgi:hypothetical protein